MKNNNFLFNLFFLLLFFGLGTLLFNSQNTSAEVQKSLDLSEKFRYNEEYQKALSILDNAVKTVKSNDDFAYIYAFKSRIFANMDSLMLSKKASDKSLQFGNTSKNIESKAVAFLSRAYLNNTLGNIEEALKDSKYGLKLLENSNKDFSTKSLFNYMMYSGYSNWDDGEKMEHYAREAVKYATLAHNKNLMVNTYNAMSSSFLVKFGKTQQKKYTDSSFVYLQKSMELFQKFPKEVSKSSYAIIYINVANYYLKYSDNFKEKKEVAFWYLDSAEEIIKNDEIFADKMSSILGIKSSFELKNNLALAESYLLQALEILNKSKKKFYYSELNICQALISIFEKKQDFQTAFLYQKKAEECTANVFNETQIFNAQKLEVLYETEKKNQELKLLTERAESRRKQNYLYLGIVFALTLGLGFMFRSYYFKLKYSIAREKQLNDEKLETERKAELQMKFETEEKARMKAEQELLEIQQQQLQKEVMASAIQIEHKNEMLQQIKTNIKEGDSASIQQLLRDEMLLDSDFEGVKMHIQKLHPLFFKKVNELANQKLTALDLKYCAYIHLQMNTKQIAQLLHVEAQSVRMFKYRLKQKFSLTKEQDLEYFLQEMGK